MARLTSLKRVLWVLVVPLLSCNLLKVEDDEESKSGRGAALHDPYQSIDSGALRLSLQLFNGCAMLPNGQMVKRTAAVPAAAYPDLCSTMLGLDATLQSPPTGQLKLVTGTPYFLNQLSITDTVIGQHTNLASASRWIKTQSVFRDLNWENAGAGPEEWSFVGGAGIAEDSWQREVLLENANWEKVKGDTFKIEVLDRDGVVRATQEYARSEMLVSTPYAGHTRFAWKTENIQPPRFPGDTEVRGVVSKPGGFPQPITYRTLARMDLVGSTNPFKTMTIPSLDGEGALRVTWSQMPKRPFYFPATFVQPNQLPVTCMDDQGQPKQCSFGLEPRLTFAPPQSGSFYKPGETVHVYVDLRDIKGNRLHAPGLLPSGNEITADQANGLLTLIPNITLAVTERDTISNVQIVGPIHEMKVVGDPNVRPAFFAREFPYSILNDDTLAGLTPGAADTKWPTRQSFKLPADAKPGTYVAMLKFHRYFMGERVAKLAPFYFQVGQDEPTNYPNAVGNCQICHRGVLSLDNLRHGLSVDHIEGCKTCHHYTADSLGRMQEMIHQIHMRSPSYPAEKNDCTMCHLTRESATRPSMTVCGSCHPSLHDTKYFAVAFTQTGELNRFGNCAQSCHGDDVPTNHILPEN